MTIRIAAWLIIASLVGAVSYGGSEPAPARKKMHHCECADICAKAAPSERCELRSCNGWDAPAPTR